MIYDGTRKLALIHRAGAFDFLIADASALDQNLIQNYSDSELEYQKLWCGFFESITIEARKNPSLPKRYGGISKLKLHRIRYLCFTLPAQTAFSHLRSLSVILLLLKYF